MATRTRLSVILHADVVDSTKLVQTDERIAHERIRGAFVAASEVIARYGGETREIRGDALLAEFERGSDAAAAALAIQAENTARNGSLPDHIRPLIRIGIALGEVVAADNTLTGGGVVLAQRLEQLASPGGVCIQGAVHESLPPRLPFDYRSLGEQSLKGFDAPVRSVVVTLRTGATIPAPEEKHPRKRDREQAHFPWIAGTVVAVVLIASGLLAWWQPRSPTLAPESMSDSQNVAEAGVESTTEALPLPVKPSVAVLAFTNMSDDARQDYFAEGIAEDIITDLSRISGLFVIARNSSFAYRERKPISIRTVGQELGVKYVLDGRVRRAGDAIRINAQLIDAQTGGHLWAERYDGVRGEVFEFQDSVTEKIVHALKVKLRPAEASAIKTKGTTNPEAYDAFLAGMRHFNETRRSQSMHSNLKARELFTLATSLDPNYSLAYAGLGWTYWAEFAFGFGAQPFSSRTYEMIWQLARKSLELGPNAVAHQLLSKRHLDVESTPGSVGKFDHEAAIVEMRNALTLEPNNADILAESAYVLAFAGAMDEARDLIRRAKRLNPNFPGWYHMPAGIVAFVSGDYESAVEELREAYAVQLTGFAAYWLTSALGQLGRLDEAAEVFANAPSFATQGVSREAVSSSLNQFAISRLIPLKEQAHMRQFLDGLGKAGVPEEPESTN